MSKSVDVHDSKYRTYVSQVEKALRAFENTSEWADLIASLAKLNKVLVIHSKYSFIPKNILIGKRLAQCLHPALPSGVHLKALESYDLIFKCIGTDKLAEDIFTYCSGLFPLLGYASINVRPTLLQLYETHFLPLGASIKPAMTGLIMGLLPGFESGSEFYDRTYQLLECFCDCVEKPYFYGCMWECICVSANIRHAGLNYILIHFDKKLSMEDQIHLIGTSLDMLVEALCLSLEDPSSLVQRCVLDLMISCFPIHNCQLPKSDIVKVLMFAVTVLLRRDMSLNRRLNAWLMGNDINGMPSSFSSRICLPNIALQKNQELNYLNNHSKELLIIAIKKLLENEFDASFSKITLLPLKIVISLLDRPELISDILYDLLLDILRCLYRECVTKLTVNVQKIIQDKLCFNDSLNDKSFCHKLKSEEQNATTEIYKTANILFAKFDSYFIWTFIAKLFESACTSSSQSHTSVTEFCDIVNFLLDKISLEMYVETQTEHFPTFLSHMVNILENKLDHLPDSDLVSALNLCFKMLSRTFSCFGIHSEYYAHGSSTNVMDSNDEANLNFIKSKDRSAADSVTIECEDEILKGLGANETFHHHIKGCYFDNALGQASNKHPSFHSHCISFFRDYLTFFYQLLSKKVFNNLLLELKCLDYLVAYTNKEASWEMFYADVLSHVKVQINLNLIMGREILECACQILEKCLVFGNYDISFDSTEMPNWFRSLIVVCLATPFDLQYVALNHVFNLIEIYQTSKRFTNFCKCCIKILNETCFYRIAASSLWRFMSENGPQNCLKAIEVFNRIHQNAPYSWICEDVIAKEMLSSNQENRIKSSMNFMSFWDCLKDLDSIKSRQFEKSIIILLDNLDSNNYMFASLSKSWVMSCAKADDLISILEPVIKVLLHPDTARVSLQQNDNKKQGQTSSHDDSFNGFLLNETKIVAVSNEGGNIVYHIDTHNRPKSIKRSLPEECHSLILTSFSDQGSDTRKCSALTNNYSEKSSFEASAVTLHVNPFGTSDEENTKVSNISQNVPRHARRLDLKTCAKEEICFNASELAQNSDNLDLKTHIVTEILDDILLNVASNSHVRKKEAVRDLIDEDINKETNPYTKMDIKKNVHSLKSYILLYTRKYDFSRVLHAVRLLKSVITTDSKLILNFLLTSNMSVFADKIEAGSAMDLFLRHKQSIMGQNFHNNLMFDVSDSINGSTYLELIVFGLLYFIRSFFNHDISQKLKTDEVQKNKEVQISCCNLLHIMFSELVKIAQGNTRLIQNISNLLLKSKVQKTLLYSMYSGLSMPSDIESSVTKPVLLEMYTNALLLLITSLIQLEDCIRFLKEDHKIDCLPKEFEQMNLDETLSLKMEVLFLSGQPLIYQPIFLEAIIYSLKSSNDEQMHYIWINFVQNLLPYFSKASTKILTSIILQLCSNLEHFENAALKREIEKLSPEYYIFIIKSLTTMYHYYLFESISDCKAFSNQISEIGILQSFGGQVISGLSNAFNFQATNKGRKFFIQEETSQSNSSSFYSQMLDLLPSILKNLLNAWKFSEQLDSLSENKSPKMNFTWSTRAKQCILWFLNPLVNNSLSSLLASFTVIWNDRFFFRSYDLMVDAISDDQQAIVNILREVNYINLNSFAIATKQMLKQPGFSSSLFHKHKFLSPEGGLLQMFYTFIKQLPDSTIAESITFVISFVRECYQSNLDYSAIFVLTCILHFILQKGPFIEEKREIKEIHDVTNKLLESCSNIAGLSLEQAYFFKRYLAVKEDLIPDLDPKIDTTPDNQLSKVNVTGSQHCKVSRTSTFSQSIQALHVLADVTATLLDVVFLSDEKDKVIPLLNNILSSVFPYLRNHKLTNMPSFRASSKLLANLSSYQYTRRSWKRECFELMLDSCFFQMDLKSLKFWVTIIDNLMAHDKSTFLDLLARFSLAQSSSLNLFSSREAESEMKIQLLKRLSFTVFCSETDQYQKHMPDIQEKLFDCLRSHNSPRLHAEVFSCFRVLVLRMSCYYLTSLWPTMITEMIQVFVIIEQSLSLESEDTSSRSFKTTDSLVNAGCDKNIDLFLAACKLLDLFLALPSESLPHFQLHKWAFVTDTYIHPPEFARIEDSDSSFIPYALKIAKQMQAKFGSVSPKEKASNSLIIHATKISSLHELQEFFSTICKESLEIESEVVTHINNTISGSYHTLCSSNTLSDENLIYEALSPIKIIESIVMNDFLDKLS